MTVLTDTQEFKTVHSVEKQEDRAVARMGMADLVLATVMAPDSDLQEGVQDHFMKEFAESVLNTGEIYLPGLDTASSQERKEAVTTHILGEALDIANSEAIRVLREQINTLNSELTITQGLIDPKNAKLMGENQRLVAENMRLQQENARQDWRVTTLIQRKNDIETIAAGQKIEGIRSTFRTIRAKGAVAIQAFRQTAKP